MVSNGSTPTGQQPATQLWMNFYCHGILHGTSAVRITLQFGQAINYFSVAKTCDNTCNNPSGYVLPGWQPSAGSKCIGQPDVNECEINNGNCSKVRKDHLCLTKCCPILRAQALYSRVCGCRTLLASTRREVFPAAHARRILPVMATRSAFH